MLYSGLNSANVTFCSDPTEHTHPSRKNPKYRTANIDIQKTAFRDRFLITNHETIDNAATSTNTSKIANACALGSGVIVGGCVWPDSNSGFGKR